MCVFWFWRWQSSSPSGKTNTNSHHCRGILGDSKLSLALSVPASLSLTIWLDAHTNTHNAHFINLSHSLPSSFPLSLSHPSKILQQSFCNTLPHFQLPGRWLPFQDNSSPNLITCSHGTSGTTDEVWGIERSKSVSSCCSETASFIKRGTYQFMWREFLITWNLYNFYSNFFCRHSWFTSTSERKRKQKIRT